MIAINRRTFVERLGLGAGAALLGPTITGLVREARGQAVTRKRLYLMVQSNGMDYNMTAPPGFKPAQVDAMAGGKGKLFIAEGITTLPSSHAALEPYKNRILQVDGLSNFVGEKNHTLTHCGITCLPGIPDSEVGQPGGPSFDQYVAQSALGKGMIYPSVLLGPCNNGDKPLMSTIFAVAKGQRAPHYAQATAAYKGVFANLAQATAPAGGPPPYNRRKKLLDFLRDDVRRTKAALAAPEQPRMDQLLGSIDALDLRMAELAKQAATVGNVKLAPITSEPAGLVARNELHTQIAATALAANLTNVIGYSAQAGNNYPVWSELGLALDAHAHGHGATEGKPVHPLDMVRNMHAGLLVKAMRSLEAVREGDGTMLDNTIFVWLSDQAEQHHPFLWRWPAIVLANPRGPLKTGGRFVRFPLATQPNDGGALRKFPTPDLVANAKAPGGRCLADLYCTIAQALGVPTSTFGSGGTEKVQGPLAELLA